MSTAEFWQDRFLFHFTQNITHWQIKMKNSSLQFYSTSRWKGSVLHFVDCDQLNVFFLSLILECLKALYPNPQERSHLSQFFTEIPSFTIIVALSKGPEIAKCVMSGRMRYPEFKIFSQAFDVPCFSLRPWTSFMCLSPSSMSLPDWGGTDKAEVKSACVWK